MKNSKENRFLRDEDLETRIALGVTGTGGYNGQPGNQANVYGNPSDSANPEDSESGPKDAKG